MSADDSGPETGDSQPHTWNGVRIPPRPPLPPHPDAPEPATPHPSESEPAEHPDAITRPEFIGLPPGMQADIDTVPATAGGTGPAPTSSVPGQPDQSTSDVDIEFSDGTRLPVEASMLIGRDPSPQAAFPDAQLVPVADVTRSVSKTHAAVQWSRGSVWVTDLHSTNGTRIRDASGRETVCVPEAPTPAPRDGGILFGRTLASLRARGSDGSE